MRRVPGTWAGDQTEVSKGVGAGQGHKQLAEVRLRSCQDASPVWKARAGAGLGAPPEESPPPGPGGEPASPPPRSARGASATRSGRLALLPGGTWVSRQRKPGRGARWPRLPAAAWRAPGASLP